MRTPPRPPYEAYAALAATFVGGLVATDWFSRSLGRAPRERSAVELVVFSLATFKAARTLAHDDVASFVREPFVESDDQPLHTGGARQAVGELVTCSRCVGTWVGAGIVATDVLAPRLGRLIAWSLAVGGANDFLQAGFAALTEPREDT